MNDREGIRVCKFCPKCNMRLFDKITPASGCVEIKCPRCKSIVTINLEFRCKIRHRVSSNPSVA